MTTFFCVIAVVCSDNSHCNAPFGECDAAKDNGVGRCSCIFGFEGMHCYSRM